MKVSSICRREVVSISANASLQQAAGLMLQEHVGTLVVTDARESGRITGVVSDRAIVVDAVARGLDPRQATIGSLCRRALVAVSDEAGPHEALDAMRRGGVRRVLVMRADGSLVGMVSADDIVRTLAGELGSLSAALRAGTTLEATTPAGEDEAVPIPQPAPSPVAG